ncbi:RNA polymerase sigma factor [Planctomycetota bacterium]
MFEDRLLIWKVKHGDSDALRAIYEKYEDDLLTLAINLLNDGGAAEDVVHDVFAKFVRSVRDFRLTGSLRGYLATCVANSCRDRWRKKQRRRTVELKEAEQVAAGENGPVEAVIWNEQMRELAQALVQLPYEQREAISLHLLSGLSLGRIAAGQEISVNTVKSRYRYGLKKLRSILNGEA